MGFTDEQQRALIERANHGSDEQRREALAQLIDDFSRPALAVIHRTLAAAGLASEHAADVLQTAALRFVATGVRSYSGRATPRTYFMRIAINAAIDTVRSIRRLADDPTGDPREVRSSALRAPEATAEALLGRLEHQLELQRALQHCISRLGPALREAVALYYLQQRGDCATCAALSGVSAAAFMQRLSRARHQLAACVRRQLADNQDAV